LVVHRLGIIAPPLTQNKTPDGGLGVAGALPRRWLRVKQGGNCGLGMTGALPRRWLRVKQGGNCGLGVTGALPRRWLRVKQGA